ncbi:hypothetical protein C8F04DRAFT_1058863 [Mycena alexandri]|uniref:Ubiquitin-like-conjugating enzyme ATG10 n=1 Tax=Mycena alexandri TaxID=1745969 RepID=A0AAD6TNL1_9AGAR|nr:hypothetical protein C8F04DRAFT_1058863 [Mycena alexandri]
MLRLDFRSAADAFIAGHKASGWTWQEPPSVPAMGYMARSRLHTRRGEDADDATDGDDDATASTPAETLTCRQYIVYSSTFQVPAFYFTLHDASGAPLPLDDLVRTTLFHRFAFEGTESTTFGVSLPGSAFPLLSQGDHPTLGTPCWYFHPCESAAAVTEIMAELGDERRGWLETWFMVLGTVVNM